MKKFRLQDYSRPAQLTVAYTIENGGLQLTGVDGSNPTIYDNDIIGDTPEVYFLWLKANRGEINLVGNINTRDMWGQHKNPPRYEFTHSSTFIEWQDHFKKATESGLRNIPEPVLGSSIALRRPSSGLVENTIPSPMSAGVQLIVNEARKATEAKPLIVVIGGNATTVANAYLADNSIADKVVVLQILGYERYNKPTSYNNMDAWATYIAMKRFRYVNWKGDLNTNYETVTPIPPSLNLTGMPDNSFTKLFVDKWVNGYYRVYKTIGDAPVTLYLFEHTLFQDVVRKLENDSVTYVDNFDYLLVAKNNWNKYWPIIEDYITDPGNYIPVAN